MEAQQNRGMERLSHPAHKGNMLQVGLAQMLKGGVIMDVTNVEEARIAEEAGAVAVMALERVPADIRRDGGEHRAFPASLISVCDASTACSLRPISRSSSCNNSGRINLDKPWPVLPGVARMSDPEMIAAIKEAVTIPVMAKARIGHFVEAQVLEALGVDYIDESEVCCCIPLFWRGQVHGFGAGTLGAR